VVRKWSYINLNSFSEEKPLKDSQIKNLFSKYKFKIFKNTTRFKKYKIGKFTSLARKLPIQLKRRTSLITISKITNTWALQYLQSKQLNRFIQNFNLFSICGSIASTNVFKTKSKLITFNKGVNIISCSNKIIINLPTIVKILSINNKLNINKPYIVPHLLQTTHELPTKQLTLFDLPTLLYEKNLYTINPLPKKLNFNSVKHNNFLLPINKSFKINLLTTITIRKLIITTTLYKQFS